jgi:hypothetical protein
MRRSTEKLSSTIDFFQSATRIMWRKSVIFRSTSDFRRLISDLSFSAILTHAHFAKRFRAPSQRGFEFDS